MRLEISLSDDAGLAPARLVARDGWPRAFGANAAAERLRSSRERGGLVRLAREASDTLGAIALRESPWDAEGLGAKAVATVDIVALDPAVSEPAPVLERLASALDDFSKERGSVLDWLRADAADTALQDVLLRRGFRVVELIFSLVSKEATLGPPHDPPRGVTVRPARDGDTAWLRELSSRAFTESRFLDPQGPPGWNALVYARWIDARLRQRDERLLFFVAELDGAPAGFLIWKVHATPGTEGLTGQVDLVAVDPRARGKRVGHALFDEARRRSPPLAWVAADVYARNALGLGLHQRYGLRVAAASTYLHRWRREGK